MFGDKLFDGVGYPTPSSVPVECAYRLAKLPADAAWLGTFMGLVETLMDEINWQQLDGGITREQAAAVWADIVQSLYDSAETGVVVDVRQNPTDPCTLEKTDDGVTWVSFADLRLCRPVLRNGLQGLEVDDGFGFYRVPDGAWTTAPADQLFNDAVPAGLLLTQNNDQCTAAANAVNVLYKVKTELGDHGADIAAAQGGGAVEVGALGVIEELFGPLVAQYASLAIAIELAALQGIFSTTEFTDTDFRKLACLVNANMTGTSGNWTLNYGAIYGGLGGVGLSFGLAGVVQLILDFVGANGLNLAAKTTMLTDYDCGAGAFANFAYQLRLVWSNAQGNQTLNMQSTLPLQSAFGLYRARFVPAMVSTEGSVGGQQLTAPPTGYVKVTPVAGNQVLNNTHNDIWYYNTSIFANGTIALAAIRVLMNDPAYSPTLNSLGALGTATGKLLFWSWQNQSATTWAQKNLIVDVFNGYNFAAC